MTIVDVINAKKLDFVIMVNIPNKPKKVEIDLEAELREELLSVPKFEKTRSRSKVDNFDLTENPFDIIKPAKRELPKRPDLIEVTKSLEAINFEDIGQTLIIRDRPDDQLRKKTLLWSNPSRVYIIYFFLHL